MNKSPFCGTKARIFLFFYKIIRRISVGFTSQKNLDPVKDLGQAPKILISAWGSLGDIFLATTVIPKIIERYPKACIGFACDPSGLEIVTAVAPQVLVHTIPNWRKQKQKGIAILLSWLYYRWCIYPDIVSTIRKESYDVSLELRVFFPTSVPIMRLAGISRRVGFISGGFEEELTEAVALPDTLCYLPLLYEILLEKIDIPRKRSILLENPFSVEPREEIILHLGTSDRRKEWDEISWREVAYKLKERGYSLVFTGNGKREKNLVEKAFGSNSEMLGQNLCNTLSIQEFIDRIKKAKVLISVDSVSVHIAACFGVRFVALYLYNESLPLWVPQDFSRNVLGCALVQTSQPIEVSDVLKAFDGLINMV